MKNLRKLFRSIFYVPSDSWKKISKCSTLSADLFVIDLEDGVAANNKSCGRDNVYKLFNESHLIDDDDRYCLRINSIDDKEFEEDLNLLKNLKGKPNYLFIPKTETIDHLKFFNSNSSIQQHSFISYCESARSLAYLKEFFQFSHRSTQLKHEGIVFGSDDYAADVGCNRSPPNMVYARQKIVSLSSMFNLISIDMVNTNFKNVDELEKECIEGKSFGFNGKQLIHPKQIETTNRIYSPSSDQMKWAKGLIVAWEENEKNQRGAFRNVF
ncbi:hypothetical protein SNEBB_002705 [Seison nebaliae]|nr:hypothetical protein SNEBB_002705 [Seison nebaliae]